MDIGGQALIEGILMRGPNYIAISTISENKKIKTISQYRPSPSVKYKKYPLLRGILTLIDTVYIGIKGLVYSTEEATKEKIGFFDLIWMLSLTLAFTLVFFIGVPFYISHLITQEHFLFNILDGLIRIIIFLVYVVGISLMPDVRRTFEYHAAEHMAIAANEHKETLTVDNVKRYKKEHERCGTAFIFIVLIISIIVFSFITGSFLYRLLSRIILIPVIAALSYEILKYGAKHQNIFIFKWFTYPGLLMQKLTTKKPDNDQIRVAISSIKEVLKMEKMHSKA